VAGLIGSTEEVGEGGPCDGEQGGQLAGVEGDVTVG
jgi:hypothetical protein